MTHLDRDVAAYVDGQLSPEATALADAHVAMLVTRSADLERRAGRPPADQVELLEAAHHALGTRG